MPRKSRSTKQKEIIRGELDKTNDFFNVEDLFKRVNNKDKNIGIATIYRFMKELRDRKEINCYTCDDRILYSKNKVGHCHFTCEETGRVIHFEVDSLDFLKNKIPGSISSFQIEVRGRCKECLSGKRSK